MSTLRDVFAPHSLVKLGLLLLALGALASGLTASLDGIRPGALLTVALLAGAIAWLLGSSGMRWGDFSILLITFGLLFVLIHAAQLWSAVGALLRHWVWFQTDLIGSLFNDSSPDFSRVRSSFEQVVMGLAQMMQRVSASIQAGTLEDLGVRELTWDFVILILAAWAGWTLKRQNKALSAFAPGMGVLAYVLYYTEAQPSSLQWMICVLLLLMGIHEWERNIRQTPASGWPFRVPSNITSTVILLSVVITLIAGLIPSVSVKRAVNRIQESSRERRTQQITDALGLEAEPNSSGGSASGGLPTEHLIGAPPTTSQAVMFTVRTGELPPMPSNQMTGPIPNYYWRALTYDVYNSRGWEATLAQTDGVPANQLLLETIPAGYRTIHMEVDKQLGDDPRLYWTGTLLSADHSFELAWRAIPGSVPATEDPFTGADVLGGITDPDQFEVDSVMPVASVDQLRGTTQDYPAFIRDRYLGLPSTLPERVRALAQEITAGFTNPYDKAVAIEAYLRTFPYSLKVPPPPRDVDVADYFLFTLRTGYCDYYATSMVVMARSVGLPARLVSGYSSGTYVPERAEYVVRGGNAHSWPEIYFSGIGWVEFEPTASQPGLERPDPAELMPPAVEPPQPDEDEGTSPEERFDRLQKLKMPVTVLLFVMAVAAAAALYWGQSYRMSKAGIIQIYPWVFRIGSSLTPSTGLAETPYMFAERLSKTISQISRPEFLRQWLDPALAELEFLTRLYVRAMYSPRPSTEAEDEQARQLWGKLYWRLLLVRILKGNRPS